MRTNMKLSSGKLLQVSSRPVSQKSASCPLPYICSHPTIQPFKKLKIGFSNFLKGFIMKKLVIAYLHTHWDREWYRDKEEFNLRLLEVVDEILGELENHCAPCFYFDGQTSALEDYLKFRPQNCERIKNLIKERKLFIGPFFASADSLLTSAISLKKNLEMGIEYSKNFGESEFIGYLSDTFGHSKAITDILKSVGINEAVLWRGAGKIPADLIWNRLNTTRLVQGYFMDALHLDLPYEKRAETVEAILEKIAKYSGDTLLLPIGADHLAVLKDANKTIEEVNKHLKNFEIKLSSPFEYIKTVKKREETEGEMLDNSTTYTLPGVYSSRIYQKVKNAKLQWELSRIVEPLDALTGGKYKPSLEYAYKELIKNHAHDSLYGCSIDPVHKQVDARFDKVSQVLEGVKKRIIRDYGSQGIGVFNLSNFEYSGLVKLVTQEKIENAQVVSEYKGFTDDKLFDKRQIPVTEDITTVYEYLIPVKNLPPFTFSTVKPEYFETLLNISEKGISNADMKLEIVNGEIYAGDVKLKLTDRSDAGDSYNFAPSDEPRELKIVNTKIIEKGHLRVRLRIYFEENIKLDAVLNYNSKYVEFECTIDNKKKNHKLSAVFELREPVSRTIAEDTLGFAGREHDPNYSLFEEVKRVQSNPELQKRQELKTNSYPMQRFVWAEGAGVITEGLNDYEIYKNTLSVTLLRATGLISNPKNPARLVSAGPPLEVPDLQCLCENKVRFALCLDEPENMYKHAESFYDSTVAFVKNSSDGESSTKPLFNFEGTEGLLYGLKKENNKVIATFYDGKNLKDREVSM